LIDHDENTPATSAAELKQKVANNLHSASDFAHRETSAASQKASAAADEQKNVIADKLGGLATAMEKAADELESGDNRDLGRMTRHLSASVQSASKSIQGQSLGEMTRMAEDFGRKQPLAFLSIAAIAGLAASRFLTASSSSPTGSNTLPSEGTALKPAVTTTSAAPSSITSTEVRSDV
jgi:ElaB/YqjD/DUF883 family membrane-anchored ribosome-binding protein